jgi:hypothetical protein
MNFRTPLAALFALLLTAATLCAKRTTFRKDGIHSRTIVALEVKDDAVSGTFFFDNKSGDAPRGPGTHFTGRVITAPKGRSGLYMEIQFDTKQANGVQPSKKFVWHLKTIDKRPHLFISRGTVEKSISLEGT